MPLPPLPPPLLPPPVPMSPPPLLRTLPSLPSQMTTTRCTSLAFEPRQCRVHLLLLQVLCKRREMHIDQSWPSHLVGDDVRRSLCIVLRLLQPLVHQGFAYVVVF